MNKKLTINITAAKREELLKKHLLGNESRDESGTKKNSEVIESVLVNESVITPVKEERQPRPLPYFDHNLFEEWLSLFRAEYPMAFPQDKRLPLAVGIRHDIYKVLGERGTKPQIDGFIRWYARNKRYLREIITGVARVSLQGKTVGMVTDKEMLYAQTRLERKKIREESSIMDHQSSATE